MLLHERLPNLPDRGMVSGCNRSWKSIIHWLFQNRRKSNAKTQYRKLPGLPEAWLTPKVQQLISKGLHVVLSDNTPPIAKRAPDADSPETAEAHMHVSGMQDSLSPSVEQQGHSEWNSNSDSLNNVILQDDVLDEVQDDEEDDEEFNFNIPTQASITMLPATTPVIVQATTTNQLQVGAAKPTTAGKENLQLANKKRKPKEKVGVELIELSDYELKRAANMARNEEVCVQAACVYCDGIQTCVLSSITLHMCYPGAHTPRSCEQRSHSQQEACSTQAVKEG